MSSNFPPGALDDPRNPINEDDLCCDCQEAFSLPGRSICGDCLRDRLDEERHEYQREQ